jgi:putative hemolysin
MTSRTRLLLILAICVIAGMLTAGCTQQPAPATTTTTIPTPEGPGIANPASVHCVEVGGTVEIKKDSAGNEYGMCRFQNGTTCDEWAHFRGEGCKTVVTTMTPPSGGAGIANPASVHCVEVGGTLEIRKNTDGSEYGMCKFQDGRVCEEWAFFRGEGCKSGAAATPAK